MRRYFRAAAVTFMVFTTILTTVLRIVLMPAAQDVDTGIFSISYLIIGVFLIAIAIAFFLVMAGKGTLPYAGELSPRSRFPMAASAASFGLLLILSSLFDIWRWMVFGKTPSPNATIISRLDEITLTLTLLFGVLAGIFCLWLAVKLCQPHWQGSAALSLGALLPVAWIWVRLVRYEVSYSSAIQVTQSFYDFIMLIFTMLFLFAFARYISRVGARSPRMLLFYSLCAALFSLSGTLSGIGLYVLGETGAYNASRLAGFPDFGVGVFAFCTAAMLVFARRLPSVPEQPVPSEEPKQYEEKSIQDDGWEAEPEDNPLTAEDILRDLNKDDGKPHEE